MKRNIFMGKKLHEKTVFAVTLCSTCMLIQFGVFSLFWILQMAVIIIQILFTQKVSIIRDKWIWALYISWIISTLICLNSDIPDSYKINSIFAIAFLIPTFFLISIYVKFIQKKQFINSLKKALIISCTIQVIWCFVQFILYSSSGLDLNQIIFSDILHMVENPSQYKLGIYHPSGMCWHSAFMAPITILAFVLSDCYIVKIIAVFDAIVCNNATALIGICICLTLTAGFSFWDFFKKTNKSTRKRTIIAMFVIIVFLVLGMFYTDVISIVGDKIVDIYERTRGIAYDGGSANAHIRYYTAYPEIVKGGNLLQFLFGYGTGSSGYPITHIFGQYADLKSWAVESDIMNRLYSNGSIGFCIFYGFLLYIAIKGGKLDRRYFIFMISIILAGVTYNIQFDWLIYIEFLFYLMIKSEIDLSVVDSDWRKEKNE